MLIPAKFNFFACITGILELYIVLIQNEKPMLPFMHHRLSKVLTLLLALVYKKKKLDETTLTKVIKEVWYNIPNNQMEKVLIDVSAATQHLLFSVKVLVKKKRKSHKKCITFVLNMLMKLNVSAIIPLNMPEEKRFMSRKFIRLANDLQVHNPFHG